MAGFVQYFSAIEFTWTLVSYVGSRDLLCALQTPGDQGLHAVSILGTVVVPAIEV
jgi:hypothetical protein